VYRSDAEPPDPAAESALAAGRPLPSTVDSEPVVSPLPLNRGQREVVRRARVEPVVVVSGPPGNGKSHAVVAAAIDVVDRGGSVLVATQSGYAAEVLGELLARYPGPTPVLFGDAERRTAVATELAEGAPAGVDDRALRQAERVVESAAAEVARLEAAVGAALELEATAAELDRWAPLLTVLRSDAPGAFADGADLGRARRLLDRARAAGRGFWGRLRSRRAGRQVRRLLGAQAPVPDAQLDAAIEAARSSSAMARLVSTGGTDLAAAWTALAGADRGLAEAVGRAMRDRGRSGRRWNAPARRSVGRLAAALRAGRGRRRELLAELPGRDLVSALPLWVGTVADVEDLLPPVPGLFDLVILDEASHVDQIRAAPVLARARRALIVGDPRQLRFVSFVADVDVAETLHRHGLDERVDVRRISAFDLAAGTAPVTWLAEHYRCAPHLIEFSAHRFYRDRIALTSRHPRNEAADVIDVRRVPDAKLLDGVCPAEVSAVVDAVRELVAAGGQGIGVVTPFRGQADALESALLAAFPVAEIERLGLRVGTVHAFQGSEADTVVASLGLTPDDAAGRRRFAADPNLFNVLVTRARRRMVVVTGLNPGEADGLIGEYLDYSERPPVPPGVDAPASGWVAALAGELARSGTEVRVGYPVGPWTVDVCLGTGEDAVGLICAVHPDGPAAHLERQRTLARAGWRLVDAFPTRWASDPARAAVDLLATPLHNPPRPPLAPGNLRPATP
jgi:AAA domain